MFLVHPFGISTGKRAEKTLLFGKVVGKLPLPSLTSQCGSLGTLFFECPSKMQTVIVIARERFQREGPFHCGGSDFSIFTHARLYSGMPLTGS